MYNVFRLVGRYEEAAFLREFRRANNDALSGLVLDPYDR
jgi:hypothetical protein